ncbi:MAG TPA: GntR family transcriptional regulator [Tepidisphaeraceae bacterium]|jgi:DNA-binding LacI/PurR family transcriptional regulator|nr:GntR family transcriptional regulator [Tepidisphaeraceae bacterium]
MEDLLTQISEQAGVAKYEQLCNQLMAMVSTGQLKAGDALPPEPTLALQLNVARSTVRQALAQMEKNGLIRRVRGKGTFIHEDAMSRLRSGLDVVALVVPEQSGFYPLLMSGFEDAAGTTLNQVIVVSTRNDAHRQGDAILQLIDKQVSGVALVPVATSPATPAYQIRQLQKNNIPVVLCHRGVEGVSAPLIAFRGHDIGRLAGEAMLRRGHRRIAFVSALRSTMAESYEAGLRQAMEAQGAALADENVIYIGADPYANHEEYERQVDAALGGLIARSSSKRATAIFTGFDAVAELIYLQLIRRGVAVPEDMSIVSFGGATRLGAMQHRLTAVTADEANVGRLAAELLEAMRSGRRLIELEERFEVALGFHEGQTLKTI